MQHIVLITTSYPEDIPGSEAAGSFVEDFAIELSNRVRVTVLAAGSHNTKSTANNLTVRRFAVPKLPLSLLNPMRPLEWGAIINTLRSGQRVTDALVREDRPDHILALWALPCGYWAKSVSTKYQIPYSVWALGSDIWSLGKIPVIRSQLRRVLRDASIRYADGFELGEQVEGISGRVCHFLPSTRRIESTYLGPLATAPPYKLAFLGRWHTNKGVDLLLDALAQLKVVDWRSISEVRIYGGGPLEEIVKEGFNILKREGKPVTLGGYLNKRQASELLRWADYLMLPSRIESIPVIFSDAAKSGLPLISTPVGDLPRLYENYHFGILATATTAADYCQAIRSALSSSPGDFVAGLERACTDFDLSLIAGRFLSETGNSR